jgi:hypothetical protein
MTPPTAACRSFCRRQSWWAFSPFATRQAITHADSHSDLPADLVSRVSTTKLLRFFINICAMKHNFDSLPRDVFRIGRRTMRVVPAFLPMKVTRRIAGSIFWRLTLAVFALKTLLPGPGFDQRVIYGELLR